VLLLTGTSGYSYAPWKGSFYPEKLPAAQMLGFYAGQLPAVEINNTFYRMPQRDLLARWAAETPAGFRFALKAPRRITHEKRLAADAEDPLRRFFEVSSVLEAKLGPTLFQLPPFLRKDAPRLEAFLTTLRALAPSAKPAFEFRHVSWFADDVYEMLRKADAALCLSESEDLETPVVATADWGYLRLRRQDYDDAALGAWAARIATQPWTEAYAFFKHEDEGRGPELARRLLEKGPW
jgi:uncharacterized protein YecE (DUF72 family)